METASKPEKTRSNKGAVVVIIVLIAVIGALIAGYFVLKDMNTLTTDNVKVTADLNTIVPTGAGKLRRLMVAKGETVAKDQIVAEADNTGYLKSPVSGEIVECDVTQGQMVSPSTVIAVVADTSDIYVQANIEETSIRRVRPGQIVRVRLDAYPGPRDRPDHAKRDLRQRDELFHQRHLHQGHPDHPGQDRPEGQDQPQRPDRHQRHRLHPAGLT